jgi:phosphate uptake regulator
METRRIQVVGNRSFAISLPKEWVKSHSLKAKETVFIERTSNNDLIIKAYKTSLKNEHELTVQINSVSDISGFLRLCYMKNIDRVILTSNRFDISSIRRLKQAIKGLEGYDITSESQTKCEISFLFHEINVTLEKLLQRMIYILKIMIESIEKKDYEALEELEETEDRLFFLAQRIIFRCQIDTQLRQDNNIEGLDNLLFMLNIFKKMENIGDRIQRLKDLDCKKKDISLIGAYFDDIETAWKKKSDSIILIKKVKEQNIDISDIEKYLIIKTLRRHVLDILDNISYIHMNKLFFQ